MNPQESKTGPDVMSALRDPERFIQETTTAVRASFEHCVDDVAGYVKKEPEKAVLCAFAAGYVLRRLPLVRIGSTFVGILVALAKPVGIVYGGAKLWQKLQGHRPTTGSGNPTGTEPDNGPEKPQEPAGNGPAQ